ncbi:sulfotransferase 4A1-like [Mizuhopecten yessoensis]|uniref:sulfotransferase 4A1-like n=1 Tax=Mizuhopecten yessoensis TaxID=6573 RepID=UPI000B457509|nr:sulfotransferase 4A1-like [Mizuhopecten yessoensis]
MALVEKTDDQGNTILFKSYKGRTFNKDTPGNVGDHLDTVASLHCRPDDVLLCTFPKSGTHWVFNIARMIQTKTLQYIGTPVMIENEDVGILDKMKSPRLFHTHLTYPFIPKVAKEGNLKLIYVLRNPKDVVLSYYTFTSHLQNTSYSGNFDGFLKAFLSEENTAFGGSWFTHTREWTSGMRANPDLKILTLNFEDLKKEEV